MRNSILIAFVASTTVLSGGIEAIAQQKQHQGMGQGMQMMQGSCPMGGMKMNENQSHAFSKGRIAFLNAELEITEEQKPLFEAYAKKVTANLSHMSNMRENMQGMKQAETPVEKLGIHIDMMEGRLDALKTMQVPLEALFDALSEEQKEKASQLMPGMACMQ